MNMNKRLFFDFLTSLSRKPRSEVLQLQFATQVRAVQAFKRSLKRSSKGKEKKEDGEAEPGCDKELAGLCKSPLTSSQPPDQPGCERRERRSGEDDVDYEDEQRPGVLKRKTGQDKGGSEEADTDKLLAASSAFRNPVGKIKKNSKTSASGPPRAGLS